MDWEQAILRIIWGTCVLFLLVNISMIAYWIYIYKWGFVIVLIIALTPLVIYVLGWIVEKIAKKFDWF